MVIAFYLPGNVPVYTFSLLIGMGVAIGLIWVAWHAPARQAVRHMDAGLVALLGGLVGGRAAFVAVNWGYFQNYPGEIPAIFYGGFSWPGALAGGLLALPAAAALSRISLGDLADGLLPLLTALTVSAWLGCWLDGCAYGPPADRWWGIPARDEWGAVFPRWPTQLIGALLALGLFWLLDRGWHWFGSPSWLIRPGRRAILCVLGLSLQLLALSFLRVDPMLQWRGLRLEGWAALVFTLLSALALGISFLIPESNNGDR